MSKIIEINKGSTKETKILVDSWDTVKYCIPKMNQNITVTEIGHSQ